MPFNLSKKIQEKELMENIKEFMDTMETADEYDAIILAKILMSSYDKILSVISSDDEIDDFSSLIFSVNDIIRMVKGYMTHMTAFNHIKKLIGTNYLIDVNKLVIDALEEIDPVVDKIDTYSDKIVKSLISLDLSDLAKKYSEANKKKLIVNLERIAKP